MSRITHLLFIFLMIVTTARAQPKIAAPRGDWRTHAERTDYRETPRYNETVAYSRRLAAASPQIAYKEFGVSGENRPLPLLIADRDGLTDPAQVKKRRRAVLLIQACIHAGESDGKDAGLALLRDIAVTKSQVALLDRVTVLFIPIYNVDGHERFGPYNRVNQNGPEQMGWRATTTNLNLNRDYVKADAPETRAWLRLWNEWRPDLFVDCHVTDGADYRYDATYHYEEYETVASSVRDWMERTFEGAVVPQTEALGHLLSPYLEFRDNRDFAKGIDTFLPTPRFSTEYAPLRNRPALLIETHMLKDYRTRVSATYDLLLTTLRAVNRRPQDLLKVVRDADRRDVSENQSYDRRRKVTLRLELGDRSTAFRLKGYEAKLEASEISGARRVVFLGDRPRDYDVPRFRDARPLVAVTPPLYYVVPAQWHQVIETVEAHGLRTVRLDAPLTTEVETYRFRAVRWPTTSFEGRLGPSYEVESVRLRRTFPARSVIVPLAQPSARLVMHLLEPQGPDSLIAWGFFNSVFERKEYAEAYLLEGLAREMLAKDENLKKEFEARLKSDQAFAASPGARLNFFFERSPYNDFERNLYPVGRITVPLAKNILRKSR